MLSNSQDSRFQVMQRLSFVIKPHFVQITDATENENLLCRGELVFR